MERWTVKRRCISSLPLTQVHPWMDCKRAVCHLLSCRLFSPEKRGGEGKKKSLIVSQTDHVAPLMEARAAIALPSFPGPHQKAIESLNYITALKLRWHTDAHNTSITWRESVSFAPAHRGFFQSGWLLTMSDCHTGGDDRGANIARRRSRCRGVIQTQ